MINLLYFFSPNFALYIIDAWGDKQKNIERSNTSESKYVEELYLIVLRNVILHLKQTIVFVSSECHLLYTNAGKKNIWNTHRFFILVFTTTICFGYNIFHVVVDVGNFYFYGIILPLVFEDRIILLWWQNYIINTIISEV